MSDERVLKETVVEEGDFLTPRVVAITAASKVSEESDKWFLYNYSCISMTQIDKNAVAKTEKTFLRGTVKGIDQEINLELPEEALQEPDLIDPFHDIGKLVTTEFKVLLSMKFLAKMVGYDV